MNSNLFADVLSRFAPTEQCVTCGKPTVPEGRYCQACYDALERELRWRKYQRLIGEARDYLPTEYQSPSYRPMPWNDEQKIAASRILAHGGSAWVRGPRGCGKTMLCRQLIHCHAWVAVAHEHSFRPAMSTAFHLLDMRETPGYYGGCGLLVIDDMSKAVIDAYSARRLHELLERRASLRLPTICTDEILDGDKTSGSGKAFAAKIALKTNGELDGKSTMDRLGWPGCVCLGVELKGDNLRTIKT